MANSVKNISCDISTHSAAKPQRSERRISSQALPVSKATKAIAPASCGMASRDSGKAGRMSMDIQATSGMNHRKP